MKWLYIIIILSCLVVAGVGCQHKLDVSNVPTNPTDTTGTGGTDTTVAQGNPCSPDTVYFKNEILPILLSNCAMSGCHDAATQQDGVNLTNYNAIISTADVDPFRASKSDLYEVLIETDPDKKMPLNGSLDPALIAKIAKWINQGALNNSCADCDTTGVMTFANHVQPIIQQNCAGCHRGSAPAGNINLSSHSGIATVANNGKLLGTIQHQSGYKPMPQNGPKLSACNITKISKWINDGAQNN